MDVSKIETLGSNLQGKPLYNMARRSFFFPENFLSVDVEGREYHGDTGQLLDECAHFSYFEVLRGIPVESNSDIFSTLPRESDLAERLNIANSSTEGTPFDGNIPPEQDIAYSGQTDPLTEHQGV